MTGHKECNSSEETPFIYRRSDAEKILNSQDVRPFSFDPLSLPIASLRCVSENGNRPMFSDIPREILPEKYRPMVLFDLDDSVWRHVRAVVESVGKATGKPITLDEYRKFGNTRNVPQWQDDMGIHDAIIRGEHPDFFPYVNTADDDAVKTLLAIEAMGHRYAYLTARPPQVLKDTLRVIAWNGMPVFDQGGYVDPQSNILPQEGCVYCGNGLPMMAGQKKDHKSTAVEYWLDYLQKQGWKGSCIVIDDLMGPFADFIKDGRVIGIAPESDVNASRPETKGEIRVSSWEEIGNMIMEFHKKAVSSDPSPYRIFEHKGRILHVEKEVSGLGVFDLHDIAKEAYTWSDAVDVQEQFQQIQYQWGNTTGL